MGLLTSLIMRPIRNDLNNVLQTSICSREELLCTITDLNLELPNLMENHQPVRPPRQCKNSTMQDFSQVVVGSMDVNSLYPCCLLKDSCGHMRDVLRKGHTTFVDLDRRFLLKYLTITVGKTASGVDKYIPQAKGTTTLHSLVTNEMSN